MDWYVALQTIWHCIAEQYPALAGGVLQFVGGATILYRIVASTKLQGSGAAVIKFLGSLALNKS